MYFESKNNVLKDSVGLKERWETHTFVLKSVENPRKCSRVNRKNYIRKFLFLLIIGEERRRKKKLKKIVSTIV